MPHEVFISYSEEDKTTADAICRTMEQRGIQCWIAPRDISAGQSWGEAIVEALDETKVMVLVFSSHTSASPHVKREVRHVVDKGITVIPFRIENVPPAKELQYYISTVHWLDAMTPPIEPHIERLIETVREIIPLKENAPVEPLPPNPQLTPTPYPPRAVQLLTRQASSRASLALAFGIISLFLGFLIIPGPIAIILGWKELKAIDAGQSPPVLRSDARNAVSLGCIGTLIGIFFFLYLVQSMLKTLTEM